jgi:putative ABC transport system substrate-binding protein
VRRREFISLLGGAAAAWPLAARAQQSTVPVIGYLGSATPEQFAGRLRSFRQGLSELGYVEGKTVVIEYRWADGQEERLPALAADLVRRQVAVLAALGSGQSALAAKGATTTIPIVFEAGTDPVAAGLVGSLSRPGGNITGVTSLNTQVGSKRLDLLHTLAPRATNLAFLLNPTNPSADAQSNSMLAGARSLGLEIHLLLAGNDQELDAALEACTRLQVSALILGPDPFFNARRGRIASFALRHGLPAIAATRDFPDAGGLMSYGGDLTESHRQAGRYVGRILKGEKPGDLPVQQVTKLALVINLNTAKALNLTIPPNMLAIADEVIE